MIWAFGNSNTAINGSCPNPTCPHALIIPDPWFTNWICWEPTSLSLSLSLLIYIYIYIHTRIICISSVWWAHIVPVNPWMIVQHFTGTPRLSRLRDKPQRCVEGCRRSVTIMFQLGCFKVGDFSTERAFSRDNDDKSIWHTHTHTHIYIYIKPEDCCDPNFWDGLN